MQASKKINDAAHAPEKQAKATAKLADKQAKEVAKLADKGAKEAAKKAKEAATKAAKDAKAAAAKAKKEAAALLKEDNRYNRWLAARETPETVYSKLGLLKMGKEAESNPNFSLFTEYAKIYSARYPDKAGEVEAFLNKVKAILGKAEEYP
ncbi:unnamed protein product [Phytophthora lilii]|uniref:Unnamed protein product n=1 Tax=Phytophthora lilii TaxID=2077276 RepID=A0A9W6UF28_9STRA|nr:unnamed protein product [Phytophthora lilii]